MYISRSTLRLKTYENPVTATFVRCDKYRTTCRWTFTNSGVGSRLDYCNGLLHVISDKNIQELQIPNQPCSHHRACPKLTQSEPLLTHLHWLPMAYRNEYIQIAKNKTPTVSGTSGTSYCSCETNTFCTEEAARCQQCGLKVQQERLITLYRPSGTHYFKTLKKMHLSIALNLA